MCGEVPQEAQLETGHEIAEEKPVDLLTGQPAKEQVTAAGSWVSVLLRMARRQCKC